jgi:hypothetical protein
MILYRFRSLLIFIIFAFLLSSCSWRGVSPAASPDSDPATLEPEETSAPAPTDDGSQPPTSTTPPQVEKNLVVLLEPTQGIDEVIRQDMTELAAALERLAAGSGLRFEIRSAQAQPDLAGPIRMVVSLPPDPGLLAMAAAAPGIHFLSVGISGIEPTTNLSVITASRTNSAEAGFLAGYIAATTTPDWRMGVLSASDTAAGVAARQGFLNGAIYFCGLCRQTYPPYFNYPLFAEAPAASSPVEWQSTADGLVEKAVRAVYVSPEAGDQTLFAYLAEAGVNLIGEGPPPAAIRDRWIASIRGDYIKALGEAWPDLLAAEGGLSFSASLHLADVNDELFSPGRQRLVEELLNDLLMGLIVTGVDLGD